MKIESAPLHRLYKPESNNSSSMRTSIKIPNYFRLRVMALILYITASIIFTYASVALAGELVLRDRPLAETEKLMTIDLFSEEKIMGQENAPIKVLESQVTIGKEYISFIPPQKNNTATIIIPDRNKRDLYLIRIPFTIHEPAKNKYYQKVRFQIELDNRDAIAFDLLPKNVNSKENVMKSYTISPQFKFRGIEGTLGGITNKISFESLHPVISAFGEGENLFYWIYESQKEQTISPGTKYAIIILDVSRGTKTITGNIFCEALISQNIISDLLPKKAKTNHYPIKWNLNEAKPLPQ
ncbi:MAG: hypothetical protein ABSE95_12505 [Thermodesulfobacteriota bacterium]